MIEIPWRYVETTLSMRPTGMNNDGEVTLEADIGPLHIETTVGHSLIEDWLAPGKQWINVRIPVRLV